MNPTNSRYEVNQVIRYRNGSDCILTGRIAKVKPNELVVLEEDTNSAGWKLWRAGVANGDCIDYSQVVC